MPVETKRFLAPRAWVGGRCVDRTVANETCDRPGCRRRRQVEQLGVAPVQPVTAGQEPEHGLFCRVEVDEPSFETRSGGGAAPFERFDEHHLVIDPFSYGMPSSIGQLHGSLRMPMAEGMNLCGEPSRRGPVTGVEG